MPAPCAMATIGSSPRLRGTRRPAEPAGHGLRFIPAPAGNTSSVSPRGRPWPVHPRACGEHRGRSHHAGRMPGSSPRLRGTLWRPRHDPQHPRFIPAPAGNTLSSEANRRIRPVHPRACGEHVTPEPATAAPAGSSPRLRGTPGRRCRRASRGRFIPAPAGNTNEDRGRSSRSPVHPRACGEHSRSCAG